MKPNDRESVNRIIAEKVMGLCWHEIPLVQYGDSSNCKKCGKFVHFTKRHGETLINQNPDYSGSLDAVHEAEMKIVEKVGFANYYRALFLPELLDATMNLTKIHVDLITADAFTRARAIVRCLENEK